MKTFDELLREAELAHGHLCAGQVLGVRLAMLGLELLGIDDPRGKDRKRLITFVEIDRCEIENKNQQQMLAYREISNDDLFTVQWVKVALPPEELPGYKGERIVCEQCGEGINFQREVRREGKILCRACAGERYYEEIP